MSSPSMPARFAISGAQHIAAGAALYAWQALNIEPAGNLFIFWMWFVAIASVLCGFLSVSPPAKTMRKNRALSCMNLSVWLFFVVALVWLGYVFLPVVLLIGMVSTRALNSKYDDAGNLKAEEPANV